MGSAFRRRKARHLGPMQVDMSSTLPEARLANDTAGSAAQHPWVRPAATALTCVAAVVVFLVFSSDVFDAEVLGLDAAGRAWAAAHRSSLADAVFRAVTTLAATRVMLTVCLIGAFAIWMRGARRAAAALALAVAIAPLTTRTIKPLFARLRPGYADDGGRSFSFPSGHTTIATAVALTLAYVMVRERVAPRLAPAIAVLFVVAVGASRVYLAEHWMTDVVGGITVGAAVAAACATVYEIARLRAKKA
jgi:membrane-associated phospholipid phosphatase